MVGPVFEKEIQKSGLKMADYEYINTRRVSYEGGATFVPVCMKCGRYVKADKEIQTDFEGGIKRGEPNATCSKCGRTEMNFEGYFDVEQEVFGTGEESIIPDDIRHTNRAGAMSIEDYE